MRERSGRGRDSQIVPGLKAGKSKGVRAPEDETWADPDEDARRERRAERFGTTGRGGRGGRTSDTAAANWRVDQAQHAASQQLQEQPQPLPGGADRNKISRRGASGESSSPQAEEPLATVGLPSSKGSPGRWLDPTRPAPPDLPALLQRLYEGLVPPVDLSSRDEAVRARMERCLRGRWHDVSVSIYGSAGSGLRVGASSDVDMCAFFPQHHRWGEKVHALLRGAEAALLEVEAVEPEVVAQLAQLDKAERSLRQLHSGMRERGLKQERLSEKLRGG